jgi:hypothetical protein
MQLSEVMALAATSKPAQASSTGTSPEPATAALAPEALSQITTKVSEVLDTKARLIKDLQYELARVIKAYNDMLHVYEAKMADWNIPTDELGFRPLIVQIGGTTIGSLAPKNATVLQQQRNKNANAQNALDQIHADAALIK